MFKWIRGFVAGVSTVALIISFSLLMLYRATIDDMKTINRHRYTIRHRY